MRNLLNVISVLLSWSKSVPGSRRTILLATIIGGIAGLGNTALIAVINTSLAAGGGNKKAVILEFTVLCLVVPLGGFISQALLIRLTARAAHELRLQLAQQIMAARYRLVEELGVSRLLATITDDIPSVTGAFTNIPLLVTQFAIMTGCLTYLGTLSWPSLLCMLTCMTIGLVSYRLPMRKAVHYFELMREQWDATFKAIRALTEGSKELKLNRNRRHEFFSRQLKPAVDALELYGIRGTTISLAATNWGQILYFVFVGVVLFVTPRYFPVDRRIMTGYALTVLYMIAPLSVILSLLPAFGRAHVAAQKVKSLGLSLGKDSAKFATEQTRSLIPWQRLDLAGVTHTYKDENGIEDFCLGPLDLTLHRGEMIFLIGGNGSGKTTLAKLIVGLYEPERGQILVDGVPLQAEDRDDYRQQFSVIFADFYLFDCLFGVSADKIEENAGQYLSQLQLDHRVQITDGKLSTTEVSQGQRKRLALLTAYLEDRAVYVFDEWASDQDPAFRRIFYYQILPDLKARGKTIIVISHDDRFYHLADRIIKLDRGQFESEKEPDQSEESRSVVAPGI